MAVLVAGAVFFSGGRESALNGDFRGKRDLQSCN